MSTPFSRAAEKLVLISRVFHAFQWKGNITAKTNKKQLVCHEAVKASLAVYLTTTLTPPPGWVLSGHRTIGLVHYLCFHIHANQNK